MIYVGAVGTLMANTGLEKIVQSAFGRVPTKVLWNNSLQMVAEVVIKEII